MAATLTITVTDAVMERIREDAKRNGTSPEEVAAERITHAVRKSETDPFMKWRGAFQSGVPDAGDRHDDYIGQALAEDLKGTGS